MKITFFSNFLNHHQLPFCLEMVKRMGDDFKFVATEKIPIERIKLGYEDMNSKYDFVVKAYEDTQRAFDLGLESDVVIIGSAPQDYIRERLNAKKITFRYSERLYKKGFNFKVWLSLFKKYFFREKNVYLLCASAYATRDFNMSLCFLNKCYKWGYFPDFIKYENVQELISKKKKNSILWVGRFIDWKHPELIIDIAKKLKEENYSFEIRMIGIGEMHQSIERQIRNYNLENEVKLLGSMPPTEVRKNMEKSEIFLFTSDKGEGWGAVLNEAMNSCCAVVVDHAIGSAPYLIENSKNGLLYKDGSFDDLYSRVKFLLNNDDVRVNISKNAYDTIFKTWNYSVAVENLLSLVENIVNRKKTTNKIGPCSKAKFLSESWYR